MIGISAKGLADWHEIGKLAWDWPIGMELEDWHEIGRLAWDWPIGMELADWHEIGGLADWSKNDIWRTGLLLDCHSIATGLPIEQFFKT